MRQADVEQRRAHGVGRHRGDGDAVDRHVQHNDEKEVQQHVQNAGDRKRRERHLRVADAAEDRGLKVVEQDHRHAEQINTQIQKRVGEHVVRHVQDTEQRRGDELAEQCDGCAAEYRKYDRRMHGALDRLVVPATDGGSDNDIRAERDANEEIDDEADDRSVRAHRRDRHRARIAREVADDRDVRGVEQLLQDRRGGDRQGEERQLIPDGAVQHVDLVFSDRFFHNRFQFLLFYWTEHQYSAAAAKWQMFFLRRSCEH